MSKSPDCPRCKNHLVIPKKMTWSEFLTVWPTVRPQDKQKKKPPGRPVDTDSELARTIDDLIDAELKTGPRERLFLPATAKRLMQNLTKQGFEIEDGAIRRRLTKAVRNKKRLRELTDKDFANLEARDPKTLHAMEALVRRIQKQVVAPVQGAIAAKKAGRPLAKTEINRLAAIIEAEATRLRAATANK